MARKWDGESGRAGVEHEPMVVVLDTSVLVAKHHLGDAHRDRALELMGEILDRKYGMLVVSDLVLTEAVNYSMGRARSCSVAKDLLRDVLGRGGPRWVVLHNVNETLFERSVQLCLEIGASRGLSFTDCTTVVLARALKAEAIASFDSGFDGVARRIH